MYTFICLFKCITIYIRHIKRGARFLSQILLYVDMKSKNAFDLKIMFNFGEKSTFQNVLLFIKTKVPDMFVLGTWWLVDQSYTLCTTKKTPNFVDLTVSQSDKIAML